MDHTADKDGVPVDATGTSVPSMQDKRKEVRPARVPVPVKLLLSLFSALFISSGVFIPWAFISENRALQEEKKLRKFLSARVDEMVSELEEVKGDYRNLIGSGDAGKSLSDLYGKLDSALREQMKNEKDARTDALEDLRGDVSSQKADQDADRRSARAAVAAVRSQLESEKTALDQKHIKLEGAQTYLQTTLEGKHGDLETALEAHSDLQTALEGQHDDLKTAHAKINNKVGRIRRQQRRQDKARSKAEAAVEAKHAKLEEDLSWQKWQQDQDRWRAEAKHAKLEDDLSWQKWWQAKDHRRAEAKLTNLHTKLERKHGELETAVGGKHDELKTSLEAKHANLEAALTEKHANLGAALEAAQTTLKTAHDNLQTTLQGQHGELETALNGKHAKLDKRLSQQQRKQNKDRKDAGAAVEDVRSRLQSEKVALEQKHANLEAALTEKHADLEIASTEKHAKLNNKVNQLQRKQNRDRQSAATAVTAVRSHQWERQHQQQEQLQHLDEQHQRQQARLDKMKKEEAVRTDAFKKLQGDVTSQKVAQATDHKNALAAVEAVGRTLESARIELDQKDTHLESRLEDLHAGHKSLDLRTGAVEDRHADLGRRTEALQIERTKHQRRLESLQEGASVTQRAQHEQQQQLDDLHRRTGDLETQTGALHWRTGGLEWERINHQNRLSWLDGAVLSQQVTQRAQHDQQHVLQQQLQGLDSRTQGLEHAKGDHQGRLDSLDRAVSNQREQHEQQQQQQLQGLNSCTEEIRRRAINLKIELEEKHANHKTALDRDLDELHADLVSELEKKDAACTETLEKLRGDVDSQKEKVLSFPSTREALDAVEKVEGKLRTLQTDFSYLNARTFVDLEELRMGMKHDAHAHLDRRTEIAPASVAGTVDDKLQLAKTELEPNNAVLLHTAVGDGHQEELGRPTSLGSELHQQHADLNVRTGAVEAQNAEEEEPQNGARFWSCLGLGRRTNCF